LSTIRDCRTSRETKHKFIGMKQKFIRMKQKFFEQCRCKALHPNCGTTGSEGPQSALREMSWVRGDHAPVPEGWTMARYLSVTLGLRGVSAVAELLEKDAPRTCEAVWRALPQSGPAQHAKYARNEVYALVPRFSEPIGLENPTVTPIPGDLVFFDFPSGMLARSFMADTGVAGQEGVIDLALFYGRNNLLLNGDVGWVPGNVYGTIVEGLDAMAEACHDVWRSGSVGESLLYQRHQG
jgi:hypothetical protein